VTVAGWLRYDAFCRVWVVPTRVRFLSVPRFCLAAAKNSKSTSEKILSHWNSRKNSKSLEFHTFVVWGKEIKAVQKRTCEKRVFVSERIKHIQPRPEPGLISRRRRSLTVTVHSGLTPSPGRPPSRHNLARQKPGTGRNQTRAGRF
jgi:hypothetical protein